MTGFQAETFPLTGCRLIEASAGTGKTYNIANLFLRLLVGDGCDAKAIDQILVVTFTRAATGELKARIREKIALALQACAGEPCDDAFIQGLMQRCENRRSEMGSLLNRALLRMDEASIFTIHGFAVRAIQVFLFETGALANVEITEGSGERREQCLHDIWRQLQLTDNVALRAYADALGIKDSEQLAKYFAAASTSIHCEPAFSSPVLSQPIEQSLPELDAAVRAMLLPVFARRQALAAQWRAHIPAFSAAVQGGKSGLDDNELAVLLACIDGWLVNEEAKPVIPARNRRPYNKLSAFIKEDNDAARVLEDVIRHIESGKPLADYQGKVFKAFLLQWIGVQMAQPDLSSMQLDEVIALINSMLAREDEQSSSLRRVITAAYPVCLVDEFQDTDPAQFEMFNRLYANRDDVGLFMIGDPKQSIYAFRGADIFSYLAVRSDVMRGQEKTGQPAIFSLDTNFRSTASLVEVSNRLFAESEAVKTFLYDGIRYEPVNSCEAEPHNQHKGLLTDKKGQLQPAMVFIGNDAAPDGDETINGDSLRWAYARDTARRIAIMLDPVEGAFITRTDAGVRTVRGGDIAVLVRTAREAAAMREALLLQQPAIPSVYQSQKDSVFQSSVLASDLYCLLVAMDDPANKTALKALMATLLYRGFQPAFDDLAMLDSGADSSDALFENLINEFSDYQRQWKRYGVLAALQAFAARRAILPALAWQTDCDRLVTDWRHLGELLQAQDMVCSSREQLILWFARQMQDDSDVDEDAKRIRLESDENLVKIVTIHVSKGLEYPVVFLPFFFMPWIADSNRSLPVYHPEPDFKACVDFTKDSPAMNAAMQREMLAEDLRLLYVAVTRAVYQCNIGVSAALHRKKPVFPLSVWAHLLAVRDNKPDWPVIRDALQEKLGGDNSAVSYQILETYLHQSFTEATEPFVQGSTALVDRVSLPDYTRSDWVVTSYSALANGAVNAQHDPGERRGGADELPSMASAALDVLVDVGQTESDRQWVSDIRYSLRGSARTGDCLHEFFEELGKDFSVNSEAVLRRCLRRHGLDMPDAAAIRSVNGVDAEALLMERLQERRQAILAWLQSAMQQPLRATEPAFCLQDVLATGGALPEAGFDFAIGSADSVASIDAAINHALRAAGVADISLPFRKQLRGLMTGSIDLLFIHNKKIYVLDYKSNTLGKAPRFYSQQHMEQEMRDNRYDLQAMIYAVAAHRYMKHRLGGRYAFDGGEYSFGGVFYLFLRGMGLPAYPGHGVWFQRPTAEQLMALDTAFAGEGMVNEGVANA